MQYQKIKRDYFIYIEKNEMVMDTITKFCISENIKNARISGIGAVKNTEIGAYDILKKEYIKKKYTDTLELISFEGNVTLKDKIPFVHSHVVLSNHDMKTLGGHLFETTISAVGEFFLTKFDGNGYRSLNKDVGLPCICLENKF